MIHGKKVVVVLPAYNAALTLEQTYREIPFDLVDDVVLVDDAGGDNTLEVGAKLGIQHLIKHEKNLGYGGNQKSCYRKALDLGADIVIMLHPDYQSRDGAFGSHRHLSGGDRLTHFGQRGAGRWHADDKIHCQPHSHIGTKHID